MQAHHSLKHLKCVLQVKQPPWRHLTMVDQHLFLKQMHASTAVQKLNSAAKKCDR
jgi:hypothetical protein